MNINKYYDDTLKNLSKDELIKECHIQYNQTVSQFKYIKAYKIIIDRLKTILKCQLKFNDYYNVLSLIQDELKEADNEA